MANPTGHDWKTEHPDVEDEWVFRTLVEPYFYIRDPEDGRDIYFGPLPEVENWIRVVVENDQLHTAYRDSRLRKRWGRPWLERS